MSIAKMFGLVSLDTFVTNIKNTITTHLSWEPYHPKNRFHQIFGINGVSYSDDQDYHFPSIAVVKEDDLAELVAIRDSCEAWILHEDGFQHTLEEKRKKIKSQLEAWREDSKNEL